jgi:hypothetical protein
MPKTAAHLPKFKKGQSGNPKGRPPDMLGKKMRQLTAEEFAEIANLIIKGSIEELRAIAKDDSQSALRVMIAAVAVKTIQKGDMNALDTLLNRLVGKVKEHVEHTNSDVQVILTMPDNGRRDQK